MLNFMILHFLILYHFLLEFQRDHEKLSVIFPVLNIAFILIHYCQGEFILLIDFTHRWLYKCLVINDTITNTAYLTCWPFSLIFRCFVLAYIAISNVDNIIIIMSRMLITAMTLIAFIMETIYLKTQGKVKSGKVTRSTNRLLGDKPHCLWDSL